MIWRPKKAPTPAVLRPSTPAPRPVPTTVSGLGAVVAAEGAEIRVEHVELFEPPKRIDPVGLMLWEKLEELDERLAARGWARISPFWRRDIKKWLLCGKLDLVARVGRRGGKGLMSAKLAILFAKYCPILNLTPGEPAFVELLSVDKDEAGSRLRLITAGFEALGDSCEPLAESITYRREDGTLVIVRVRAASIRAVGGTAILILEDEVALWRDSATGANPAREIDAQIGAELASQPHGRRCRFSAPYGENDFHSQKFDEGETETQCVAYAPTWVANPSISERQTKALEPNVVIWARSYLAQPIAAVTAIATKEELAAVTRAATKEPYIPGARYVGTLDAGLKHDAWVFSVWCLMLRRRPDGGIDEVVTQVAILRLAPTFFKSVDLADAIRLTIKLADEYGVTVIYADGHYSEAVGPALVQHAKKLEVVPMTSAAITARIENLQLRIQNGTISFLKHDEQTREALGAQLVTHAGGRLTLRAPERRGAHDDHVSTILLACDVEAVAKLPPADGEVIVKRDPFCFDHETRSILGGKARYFRRTAGGHLVPSEPPYGTREWIEWMVELVGQNGSTDSIHRWARDLGVEVTPGMNPRLLDPEYRMRMADEEPARPVFVGVVADEPEWLTRAKRNAPRR